MIRHQRVPGILVFICFLSEAEVRIRQSHWAAVPEQVTQLLILIAQVPHCELQASQLFVVGLAMVVPAGQEPPQVKLK